VFPAVGGPLGNIFCCFLHVDHHRVTGYVALILIASGDAVAEHSCEATDDFHVADGRMPNASDLHPCDAFLIERFLLQDCSVNGH